MKTTSAFTFKNVIRSVARVPKYVSQNTKFLVYVA